MNSRSIKMKARSFLVLLLFSVLKVKVQGTFSLVGSRITNFGEDYHIFVTANNNDLDEAEVLQLKLDGDSFGDVDEKTVKLDFDQRQITFALKNHEYIENFTLTASIANLNYIQTINILQIAKKSLAIIQTDKSNYNPGEKVKFQIIFLNDDLLSYQPTGEDLFSVVIKDEFENTIYQREIEFEEIQGNFDDSFEIKESSAIGKFQVEVTTGKNNDDEKKTVIGSKVIEVVESVEDDFNVEMTTNFATAFFENDIKLDLSAKYSFGHFVKGTAVIKTKLYNEKDQTNSWQGIDKTIEIDNKEIVKFNIVDDLKISSDKIFPITAVFEVEFVETFTGRKKSSKHSTTICNQECHKIDITLIKSKIKPGFPFTFQVNVYQTKTMKLVNDDDPNLLEIEVKYFDKTSKCVHESSTDKSFTAVLKNGSANVSIEVPRNTSQIVITSKFLNSTKIINLKPMFSQSNDFLKMQMVTENPQIGQQVQINVESTAELEEFYCLVMQSSNIFHHETLHGMWSNEHEVEFTATTDMKLVQVIVYYVHRETGEIIYDEVSIDFDNHPKNLLEISVSPTQLSPGGNCTILMKTTAGSIVTLIAVDKQISMKSNNKKVDYLQNLKSKKPFLKPMNNLDLSNAFIITDVKVEEENCRGLRFERSIDDDDKMEIIDEDDDHKADGENFDEDEVHFRDDNFEAWIFESFKTDKNDQIVLTREVPNAITSWHISAISFHPELGLTFSEIQEVEVSKQFFVKMNFPLSVQFGEIFKVDILVFNYVSGQTNASEVEISFSRDEENDDFEFIDSSDCSFIPKIETKRQQVISVESNSQSSISFFIRPFNSGSMKFKVKATSDLGFSDELEKTIKVLPEIQTTFETHSLIIDLRNETHFAHGFNLPIPEEAVSKSIEIEGVVGNLLEPLLRDASRLLKPQSTMSSTEENTFSRHLQQIISIQFLKAANQSTHQTEADDRLKEAYKNILERKISDGSFSFKGYGRFKSIWLTSLVAKCLAQSKMDDSHVKSALDFLKKHQVPNDDDGKNLSGSFIDFGNEKTRDIPLTAFVLTAFLENHKFTKDYEETLDKGLGFIDRNIASLRNNHDFALCAYVFSLANHSSATNLLQYLKANAIVENDKKYWKLNDEKKKSQLSDEIEVACYAFLAFFKAGEESEVFQIMTWIISQLNTNDGILKDSIVATQFLVKVAQMFYSSNLAIDANIYYENEKKTSFHIDKNNANMNFRLPANARNLRIFANGTGLLNVDFIYKYSTFVEKFTEKFTLSVETNLSDNDKVLHLTICTHYKINGDSDDEDESDDEFAETIMEINLPKGYVYNFVSTNFLRKLNVKKVETHNRKSTILLHFEKVAETKVCPEIYAFREFQVEQKEKSSVRIYKGLEKRAVEYYTLKGSQYCEGP